ncbi:arylesterase [Hydrogenovibrio sp. SC-1]|nr:arylesterase [Hydrogenovibrio sp. SC-1]
MAALLNPLSVTQAQSTEITAKDTNSPAKLLVLGDSLSAAYGMAVEQGWVALLSQKLHPSITIVNASISGETSSGGKNRLPALLKQHQPNWLILELGANDALRGQSLRSLRKNLTTIIEQGQQAGAEVLLLGIRLPTNYGPAYDEALSQLYQDLADRYQLLFDPFFLAELALDPQWIQADGLHPNAQAQPKILQRLWPRIQMLIGKDLLAP